MKLFNKSFSRLLFLFCLLMTAGVVFHFSSIETKAAEYKTIYDENGNFVKSGKYYFKWNKKQTKVMISTNKSKGYKETPIDSSAFANGSQAYYIRNNTLYKYVFSSKKETSLKKIKVSGDESVYISTIYQTNIFLTKASFDQWKYQTYCYHTVTKKLSLARSDCTIADRDKNYVVAQTEFRTDISPYPLIIYKITASGGLSKVTKLTSYGRNGCFISGKLYYTSYPKNSVSQATLYRCNPNGSKKQKIKTFSASKKYGEVVVTKITAKYCDVYIEGKNYRYTYATKKTKKLN